MAKKKFDPLEEAKIGDDKEDKKKLSDKKKKEAKADPPPPPPAPEAPAKDRAATKPDKPMAAGKRYRVLKDKVCSVRGQMTTLRAGKILEARSYGGEEGLLRVLSTGVEVEEC